MPGLLDYLTLGDRLGIGGDALLNIGAGLLSGGGWSPQPGGWARGLSQGLLGANQAITQGPRNVMADRLGASQLNGIQQWDRAFGPNADPNNPLAAGLTPQQRSLFGALGYNQGAPALATLASRQAARAMTPQESTSNFGRVIPGAYFDQNGAPRLAEGPAQAGMIAGSRAAAEAPYRVTPLHPGGGFVVGVPGVGGAPVPPMPGSTAPAGPAIPRTAPYGPLRTPISGTAPIPQSGVDARNPAPTDPAYAVAGLTPEEARQPVDGLSYFDPSGRPYTWAEFQARNPSWTDDQPQPSVAAPQQQAQAAPPAAPGGIVRVPGQPNVYMDLRPAPGTQEGRYNADVGVAQAGVLSRRMTETEAALGTVGVIHEMRGMLDRGLQVGPGFEIRTWAADFLRSFGGEGGSRLADRIMGPDARAFSGLTAREVLNQIGGSLGVGISNADRSFIERQVPQPFASPESTRRFMDILEQRALGNIQRNMDVYMRSAPNLQTPEALARDPVLNTIRVGLSHLGYDPASLGSARRDIRRRIESAPQQAPTPAPSPSGQMRVAPRLEMAPDQPPPPVPAPRTPGSPGGVVIPIPGGPLDQPAQQAPTPSQPQGQIRVQPITPDLRGQAFQEAIGRFRGENLTPAQRAGIVNRLRQSGVSEPNIRILEATRYGGSR